MYLRRCYGDKDGKRHGYGALVESYRTARGPRQRVVAWLGEWEERGRWGIRQGAPGTPAAYQQDLFEEGEPEWVEGDRRRVRVERRRQFGGPWLGRELMRRVGGSEFLQRTMWTGREEIPWGRMAVVLGLGRRCDPGSELHLAEDFYESSARAELLGVPAEKGKEDRLYRALDRLLPHQRALEKHWKERLGERFELEYDLLLYDVTSTYFEGEAARNPPAQRGYSRDHRPDCQQVNIAWVVSRSGMPLGYEVFAGHRADGTTLEEIVEAMEAQSGKANRIWGMDRGMGSEDNVEFLKRGGRRYIVGTPQGMLQRYEQELLAQDWQPVHEGLEVRWCPAPEGEEVFILCRSAQRRQKEQALHERFEKRIEEGLRTIEPACRKRKQKPLLTAHRVGRWWGQNTRAAGLFQVQIEEDAQGAARFCWTKSERWRDWARRREGCYLLRSNGTDGSAEELWRAYIQWTEAEAAFRIQKTDLQIRPVWHQKPDRVQAHILVCFLASVLWKTLAQVCRRGGLGDEPRKVFDELSPITLVDVVLPTRKGIDLRKRCISRPTEHQSILLHRLRLSLPSSLEIARM